MHDDREPFTDDDASRLARRVVARFTLFEMREMLETDYVRNYEASPDAYYDDLAQVTAEESAESRSIVLHLRAPNDINGNPRRCYVVIGADGAIKGIHDEGYLGPAAWKAPHPNAVEGPSIGVSVSTYNRMMRLARKKG